MKVLLVLCLLFQVPGTFAQAKFDDADLARLLKDSRSGIIFSWSPLMPLSVLGLSEITQISQEHGFDLTVLIDPHPHIDFEPSDNLLVSKVLIDQGMLNHFPSATLYANGSLLPWMIQGYESKESLENLIISKLGKL